MRFQISFILVILLLSATSFAQKPSGELEILFVSSGNSLLTDNDKELLNKAMEEIGYKVVYRTVPLGRGPKEISNSSVDGELVRIREYGYVHPELVRVEEPFATAYFSIYSKPHKKVPCTWKELIDSKLRIDFQRGIYYFEMNLSTHLSDRIQAIDTPVQMFRPDIHTYSFIFNKYFGLSKTRLDITIYRYYNQISDLRYTDLPIF